MSGRRRGLAERFWRFRGSHAFEDAASKGLVAACFITGGVITYVNYATGNGTLGLHGICPTHRTLQQPVAQVCAVAWLATARHGSRTQDTGHWTPCL
eukprot:scaffold28105_cov139-Isochrysis_galbana.AAC.4